MVSISMCVLSPYSFETERITLLFLKYFPPCKACLFIFLSASSASIILSVIPRIKDVKPMLIIPAVIISDTNAPAAIMPIPPAMSELFIILCLLSTMLAVFLRTISYLSAHFSISGTYGKLLRPNLVNFLRLACNPLYERLSGLVTFPILILKTS